MKKEIKILVLILVIIILLFIIFLTKMKNTEVNNITKKDTIISDNINNEIKWYGETSLIEKNLVLPTVLIKSLSDFESSQESIALLAEILDSDVSVYGLKKVDSDSYYMHGICIRSGCNIYVLDVAFGMYGELPQIQCGDYDEDGQDEFALIIRTLTGSGCDLLSLFIVEEVDGGRLEVFEFTNIEWSNLINSSLQCNIVNGSLTYNLYNGRYINEIAIENFETENNTKVVSISFGNSGYFEFIDNDIYLNTKPFANCENWVTPQDIAEDYVKFQVIYNREGKFSLNLSDN